MSAPPTFTPPSTPDTRPEPLAEPPVQRVYVPFPLRHFWPLALVAAMALAAVGVALLAQRTPAPPPEEVAVVAPSAQGGGQATPMGATALLVSSEPFGAAIAIDGETVGTTPLLVEGVRVGTRRVVLSLPGFVRVDTVMGVTPGAALRVDLARAPAPPPPTAPPTPAAPVAEARPTSRPAPAPASTAPGRLDVVVQPWGTIYIDGQVHRRDSDVTYRTDLPPGTHRVRAVHPMLGEMERTVTVPPGGSARITLDLNAGAARR